MPADSGRCTASRRRLSTAPCGARYGRRSPTPPRRRVTSGCRRLAPRPVRRCRPLRRDARRARRGSGDLGRVRLARDRARRREPGRVGRCARRDRARRPVRVSSGRRRVRPRARRGSRTASSVLDPPRSGAGRGSSRRSPLCARQPSSTSPATRWRSRATSRHSAPPATTSARSTRTICSRTRTTSRRSRPSSADGRRPHVARLCAMTRVALIDDHESVRLGLEAACARAQKVVVFSGSNVTEYLDWRAFSGAPPADVVVLDLTLGDGTTVTENVRRLVLGRVERHHPQRRRPAGGRARGARRRCGRSRQQGVADRRRDRGDQHGRAAASRSTTSSGRAPSRATARSPTRSCRRASATSCACTPPDSRSRSSPTASASRTPPRRRTSRACG